MYGELFVGTPAASTRTMSFAFGITFFGGSYWYFFSPWTWVWDRSCSWAAWAQIVGTLPADFMRLEISMVSSWTECYGNWLNGSTLTTSSRHLLWGAHVQVFPNEASDKLWKSGVKKDGLKCGRTALVSKSDLSTSGLAKKVWYWGLNSFYILTSLYACLESWV